MYLHNTYVEPGVDSRARPRTPTIQHVEVTHKI